ncbi:hypothetical protein MASR2M64_10520 [Candidatus Cloacimonadota bacterium]|nr:hypothetical protein [Candidatus Cloacimonadota bacterium]MDD3235308.1 hypothetical protein [Candidatus Cloacimonadota bacterium]
MTYKVVLIKIDHRSTEAAVVQDILTQYGCNIKVRLGLHEVSKEFCANDGLIVLEVEGKQDELSAMLTALKAVNYVQAQIVEM